MKEYGTVIVTLADEDKEEALPLVKRFYHLGFNIEATAGTAAFLKKHGIRTRVRGKLSEGSTEILDSIRAGYVSYVINTRAILSGVHFEDGVEIRRCAVQNGVTIFTSLDTVKIVLDVLEEITPEISTINATARTDFNNPYYIKKTSPSGRPFAFAENKPPHGTNRRRIDILIYALPFCSSTLSGPSKTS